MSFPRADRWSLWQDFDKGWTAKQFQSGAFGGAFNPFGPPHSAHQLEARRAIAAWEDWWTRVYQNDKQLAQQAFPRNAVYFTTRGYLVRHRISGSDGEHRYLPVATWSGGGFNFLDEAQVVELLRGGDKAPKEALQDSRVQPPGGFEPETRTERGIAGAKDMAERGTAALQGALESKPARVGMGIMSAVVTVLSVGSLAMSGLEKLRQMRGKG
jgi:hypothetical protein